MVDRIAAVRQRLTAAGGHDVTLVGVAKTMPVEAVVEAVEAGLADIGESYAQELETKLDAVPPGLAVRWHFVGALQRNKVRRVAGRVALWQSVDRLRLVDEIARRQPGAAVLVQVNTTDEPQKAGCGPGETAALVDHARSAGLDVRGLMTIGQLGDEAASGRAFRSLRSLANHLDLYHCSMGMTDDLEIAVSEGSTMVRVGRDIFGPRARPG